MQHKHVRGIFATHIETLKNWERNVGTPMVRHFPAIIRFLGYVPFSHDGTPGGQLAFLRKCVGLTQRELGQLASVNLVDLWRYERNRLPVDGKYRAVVTILLNRTKHLGLPEIQKIAFG